MHNNLKNNWKKNEGATLGWSTRDLDCRLSSTTKWTKPQTHRRPTGENESWVVMWQSLAQDDNLSAGIRGHARAHSGIILEHLSKKKYKLKIFFVCLLVWHAVVVMVHAWMEIGRQLVGFSSLLPPCGAWEPSSGHQAWWQALSPCSQITHQDINGGERPCERRWFVLGNGSHMKHRSYWEHSPGKGREQVPSWWRTWQAAYRETVAVCISGWKEHGKWDQKSLINLFLKI